MHRYKIIHLDDHKIITDCTRDLILSAIANCDFISFNDTDNAFNRIVDSMNNGEVIDIFITDFTHCGMDGYILSKSIRKLEKKKNKKPMPILLLTMHSKSLPAIRQGLKEKLFNRYLQLFKNENKIVDFVKNNLVAQ